MGRQTFLILFRINKPTLISFKIHQEAAKKVHFKLIKCVKETKKRFKGCIMNRQNVHIHLWWSTVLPMLRTSDFDKLNLARWFGFRFMTIFANDQCWALVRYISVLN